MHGPKGEIDVLINWRQQPIDNLVVRFPPRKDQHRVHSLLHAGVFQGHLHKHDTGYLVVHRGEDGVLAVRLRMAVTNYLLVD